MKRVCLFVLGLCLALALMACNAQSEESDSDSHDNLVFSAPDTVSEPQDNTPPDALETKENSSLESNGSKVLVVYFSCTGNTAPLAEYVARLTGGDLYEIVAQVPYTENDIAYQISDCRANVEQNDDTCRPAIQGKVNNIQDYDVVFVAFPIWWGKEPRIIDTFMESYDFAGKTMIPFCTSGSTGISTAESNLHAMTDDTVQWLTGSRFAAGTTDADIQEWLSDLGVLE